MNFPISRILLVVSFSFVQSIYCQVTLPSKGDSGESNFDSPTSSNIANSEFTSDVDMFTGLWNSQFNLGTVSTKSGLSFTCALTYNSAIQLGSTFKNLSGLPYGDNWNLSLPMISVKTEDFHRYSITEMDQMNTIGYPPYVTPLFNIDTSSSPPTFDCNASYQEGKLYWYSPIVSIPGVGSSRMTYVDSIANKGYVFYPHTFESFFEAHLIIEQDSLPYWNVISSNGTVYKMELQTVNHRQPSNQRVQKECYQSTERDSILAQLFLPKTEFNSWYCTKISHPNKTGTIQFEYAKYGNFQKFPQLQDDHKSRINNFFFDGNKSAQGLEDTHEKILLKSISSPTERLILNYDYLDQSKFSSTTKIVHPDDSDITTIDSFFVKTEVKKWNTISDFNEWHRYLHGKSSDLIGLPCPDVQISQTNPYSILYDGTSDQYNFIKREKGLKARQNDLNSPTFLPFNSLNITSSNYDMYQGGYLESNSLAISQFVPGDFYTIEAELSHTASTASLFDISIVTGDQAIDDFNFFLDSSEEEIYTGCYAYGKNQFVNNTFANPLKNVVIGSDSISMFFNLPALSSYKFDSLRVQIGPANSDIDFAYDICDNDDLNINGLPETFKSYFNIQYLGTHDEYDDTQFYTMNSGASTPNNFGIGTPWFLFNEYYSNIGLNLFSDFNNPTQSNNLIGKTWWNGDAYDGACSNVCNYESNPVMTHESAQLTDARIFRISEFPLILNTVQKEMKTSSGSWAIHKKYGFNYKVDTLQNTAYYNVFNGFNENNTTINSELHGLRYVLNLVNLKVLSNNTTSTFSNSSSSLPTYHYDYETKTYSTVKLGREGFHSSYSILNNVTNPLGLEKQITYHHPDFSNLEIACSSILGDGFSADSIVQIPPGSTLSSYLDVSHLRSQSWFQNPNQDSLSGPCIAGNTSIYRVDNGIAFTIYNVVDSITTDQGYQTNVWNYDFFNLKLKLEPKPSGPNFEWDMINFDKSLGFDSSLVFLPQFDSNTPYKTYSYSTSNTSPSFNPLFGKLISTNQYDGQGTLINSSTYIYDSLRITNKNWASMSNILHPDFMPTNRMYDVPIFYDTRFASVNESSSFFVKLLETVSTHYLLGESISTKTTYEYFDCDFNLVSNSDGIDSLLGISFLTEYPSFNLYRTITSSVDFPGVSNSTEYFYLYDLINDSSNSSLQVVDAFNSNERSKVFQTRSKLIREGEKFQQSSFREYFRNTLLLKEDYIQINPFNDIGLVSQNTNINDNSLRLRQFHSYDAIYQIADSITDVKGEISSTSINGINGQIDETTTSNLDLNLPSYTVQYNYDTTTGLLNSIIDENNTEYSFTYDNLYRLSSKKRNNKTQIEYEYSNWNNEDVQIADLPICSNHHLYAGLVNQNYVKQIEHIDTLGTILSTKTHLDPYGRNVMTIVDSVYRQTNIVFDPYGRKIEEYDFEGCRGYDSRLQNNAANQNYSYDLFPQSYLLKSSKLGEGLSDNTVAYLNEIVDQSDLISMLSTSGNSATGYIINGKYYYEQVTDEDGKFREVVTDILGNTILATDGFGDASTVFKYDSRNNLTAVNNAKNQESTYDYNYAGQVFHTYKVDCGDEYFSYDHLGENIYHKTVLSEELHLRDGYGRLISTGKTSLDSVDILSGNGRPWISSSESYSTLYSNLESENDRYYSRLFYDETSTTYSTPSEFSSSLNSFDNANNRLRQSISFNEQGSAIHSCFYGYDSNGFEVYKATQLDTSSIGSNSFEVLISCERSFLNNGLLSQEGINLNADALDDFVTKYQYDNRKRLIGVKIPHNYSSMMTDSDFTTIASYNYNDTTDLVNYENRYKIDYPLVDSCSTYLLDSINYTYDQRYRLTEVLGFYFDEYLYYDENNLTDVTNSNNYNGNINGIKYVYPTFDTLNFVYNERTEGFSYDNYNRLVNSDSKLKLSCNTANPGCIPNSPYAEEVGDADFTYDKIGNILTRFVTKPDTVSLPSGHSDETSYYEYEAGTNRLTFISPSASSFSAPGSYDLDSDAYGNIILDEKNGVVFQSYDRNYRPATLTKDSAQIKYTYNENNLRLYKEVYDSLTEITSLNYYVKDYLGNTIGIMDQDKKIREWNVFGNNLIGTLETPGICDTALIMTLLGQEYIDRRYRTKSIASHRIISPSDSIQYTAIDSIVLDSFFFVPVGSSFSAEIDSFNCALDDTLSFKFNYYNLDHLGNVRIKYTNECRGDSFYIAYENLIDYLPFGEVLKVSIQNKESRYQYNGKEKDIETGYSDYGFRLYATNIGRFMSVDPLMERGLDWSPFTYTFNSPNNYTDPDGLWPLPGIRLYNKAKQFKNSLVNGITGSIEATFNLIQGPHLESAAKRHGDYETATAINKRTVDAAAFVSFEALTGYAMGKVFRGASALYPAAPHTSKSIALGLKKSGLEDFGVSKAASIMDNWADDGLISPRTAIESRFDLAFKEATDNVIQSGGKIHFNLDGVDLVKALNNRGKGLYDEGVGYTDWELGQILDNQTLLNNTIFYNNSGKVDIMSVVNQVTVKN